MISSGAILIKNGTLLPDTLGLEKSSGTTGWASVTRNLDGRQLATALATAGWTYFFMAGTIRRIAFGFQKQKMIASALKSVLAAVKLQSCNCLEIDEVAMHSFLGMPYVSVSAHSRHIQERLVFAGV
jgi:hypothetical protein